MASLVGDSFLEFICHPPYLNLHSTVANAPDNIISNGENNILRRLDVVQEVALPLRLFDVVDVGRRSLLVRQAKVAYRVGGGATVSHTDGVMSALTGTEEHVLNNIL